jgi:hypothetical protein
MSYDRDNTHTYDAGRNEYTSRPRRTMVVMTDGKERCGSEHCDGSCNDASERKNEGAEAWLARQRGQGER